MKCEDRRLVSFLIFICFGTIFNEWTVRIRGTLTFSRLGITHPGIRFDVVNLPILLVPLHGPPIRSLDYN